MKPMVEITSDAHVRVRVGKVELGQGLHTALAQIVAESLGVPIGHVRMLPVDTDESPDQGVTSGSRSIEEAGTALREACAALREACAALHDDGAGPPLPHAKRDARDVPRPDRPEAARDAQDVPRLDLPRLLAGEPHFIHDLRPDGLLHGRVIHPPRLGARAVSWDDRSVRAFEGVVDVRRDGDLFGVVCASGAAADRAAARLAAAIEWSVADDPPEAPADLLALPGDTRVVFERDADVRVARTLAARYSRPWIAHASIAPSCALAQWTDDRLHVWSHTQGVFNLRRDLALAFGLAPERVRVTHVPGAGCYGHNGADDVAYDAAWLARAVPGRPLRVRWSRADELSHAPFGPAMVVDLEAGLDDAGRIVRWRHDVCSPGHSRRPGRSGTPALLGAWQTAAPHAMPRSVDLGPATGGGAERNAVPPYDIPAVTVRARRVDTVRRSSALRALGAFANVFAAESFVDEIAHATGIDPLALRRRHLQHDARALRVLDAVVERSGWAGRTRAEGVGHGLAQARYKGTGAWCAVVAEVHAAEVLHVRRLTIAVDVGAPVSADGVASQIEGGAVQATSWTLKESARAAHAGWDDYPILRFSEAPAVDVVVLPSTGPSLGAGEASLGPTAAAIGNALFDALGVRVRDLPLTPDRIVAAMGG